MGVTHMAIPAPLAKPIVAGMSGAEAVRCTLAPSRKLAAAGYRTAALRSELEQMPLNRAQEQESSREALARLARQCLAGDSDAWQQLVASEYRRIYAICYRFTGSGADAEDLTQEVFLKLFNNLSSFDTQKGSFQTWITTLARNLLVDHFRRTRQDRQTDSIDVAYDNEDGPTMADRLADPRSIENSQERQAANAELGEMIQRALKHLSPELREAVILRDLEDMDYKEIAEVLHIPEGTVKSRISRGRGELARLLERIKPQTIERRQR